MPNVLLNTKVTVVFLWREEMPYGASEMAESIQSVLDQDYPHVEIIIADSRGESATADFLPAEIAQDERVWHLPGDYGNRSAAWNAALEQAEGDQIVFVANEKHQVRFKKSGIRGMSFTAQRNPKAGLVASDYDSITADGTVNEIHLLPYHEGRVRDAHDLGSAWLIPRKVIDEVGKLNEQYTAGDFYDLRLRISEKYDIVHMANRYSGSMYSVAAPAEAHNVFGYLLVGKDAQLELENVLTEHLKRIGAYMAPKANYHKVEYTADEQAQFDKCVATVVIPVNNRPDFNGSAIESVQAQTMQNVEVIVVVNGGESDPTCDAVRKYMEGGEKYDASKPRVDLIVLDINNLGVCLNSGIDAANGKYYVQLDSDDRLKPDAVEKLVKVYDSDPTIGMVIGSYEVWQQNPDGSLSRDESVPVVTHDEWTEENGRNNLLRIGGAGAPRSAHIKVIRDVGWFGTNDTADCRNYGEDYELVNRIIENYQLGRVWDPIYEVIRHSGGTDHSIDQVTIDRNENAKDNMRREAIHRRIAINKSL